MALKAAFGSAWVGAIMPMAGEASVEIEDHAAAAQREHYDERSGKQIGDPRKLAEAIVKVVASEDPPLRYAAGSDAVRMTRETLEKRLAELARWEELSNSTDADPA